MKKYILRVFTKLGFALLVLVIKRSIQSNDLAYAELVNEILDQIPCLEVLISDQINKLKEKKEDI